jgi:hypothetical protein
MQVRTIPFLNADNIVIQSTTYKIDDYKKEYLTELINYYGQAMLFVEQHFGSIAITPY